MTNRAVAAFFVLASLAAAAGPSSAQERRQGLEVGVLPAINFDADEGFGYGILAELYQYGDGEARPYEWTVQPKVFLTTEGRRDVTLFLDSPKMLGGGWRLDAFLGTERQVATPFYGVGNATLYDESRDAEDGPDPYYYRFGRDRQSATFNLQRDAGGAPIRWLFGAGLVRTGLTAVSEGTGTSLFAETVDGDPADAWSNYVRTGLVWDSRDRETAPTGGAWTEFIVQRVDESFGADASYTRWTFADRRYFALGERLVFAHRYLLQGVTSGAPVHELFRVQTSFKQEEGLGGAKSLRGIAKNRYVGRGLLIWNAELRLRAADFRVAGRAFHLVLSGFVDQGRVWEDEVAFGDLLADLHRGYGGGVRVGMGENFTVAVDAGTSSTSGLGLYIGLGYLY